MELYRGNNLEILKQLSDNSIDSVVTDPPYGLSFMNKKWDYDVPSVDFWKEVYRVLKPGGHVLSFGGTRTYHRMVVNIEDAGFEIRDQIMWLYGSGFPKSLNIGKAVDKLEGNEREVVGINPNQRLNKTYLVIEPLSSLNGKEVLETKGTSPYEGWGTALKPANEPICVARKPLSEKSVAENVLKWRTGGINIDGCRIKYDEGRFPANLILDEEAAQILDEQSGVSKSSKITQPLLDITGGSYNKAKGNIDKITERGHNDSGGASRFFYIPKVSKKERNMGLDHFEGKEFTGQKNCSKCSICNKYYQAGDGRELCKCEKPNFINPTAKNIHPTVKPVQLMAYLCRLITPKDGIVLDPYMGSGSTGISAQLEGFNFIGIEMDEEYFKIAEARIKNFESYRQFVEKKPKKNI